MGTVHIRIRHDDDFVVAQLRDIEIVAVALGKTAAERIYHGLDFRIGEHLVNACLFHIKNFTADGKDCLIHTVSCHFGAAARRIPFDDKDFAFGSILGLAVCQFAVAVKGELLLGQHIGLCLFLRLTDFGSLFGAGYDALQGF